MLAESSAPHRFSVLSQDLVTQREANLQSASRRSGAPSARDSGGIQRLSFLGDPNFAVGGPRGTSGAPYFNLSMADYGLSRSAGHRESTMLGSSESSWDTCMGTIHTRGRIRSRRHRIHEDGRDR